MRLVITHEAAADLEAIGDYIAEESPRRAVTFVQELRLHCASLLDMPKRFPLTPRHETSGIRRMIHGDFLIFYRVSNENIEVLRILHGARDYEPLLFPTE